MPRPDSSANPMDAMTRNTAPRAMHSAAPTRCIKCPEATTATRVLVMATAKTCPASRSVPPGRTPAARPGKWRHKKWTEGNWLRKTGRIDWRACRWRAVASEFSHALNRPFCSTATWGIVIWVAESRLGNPHLLRCRRITWGPLPLSSFFQTAETTKPLVFLENQGFCVYRIWR